MYDPRQQALMAQMFGTGGAGGQPQPPPGPTAGGMGIAPSFDAGQIANSFGGGGVGQPLPNWQGPPPNFSMQPFDPASGPQFQDLGGGSAPTAPPISAGEYQPDGFFQGAAGSFNPGDQESPPPSMRGPSSSKPPFGRGPGGMKEMAPGFNPGSAIGETAGRSAAPGFDPNESGMGGAAGLDPEERRRRNVLIQAIMKQAQAR